jgi:hypothetical protein
MRGSLDDQPVQLSGGNPLGKSGTESVEEIENAPLFLMDFMATPFELADPATGTEHNASEYRNGNRQCGDHKGFHQLGTHCVAPCTKSFLKTSLGTLAGIFSPRLPIPRRSLQQLLRLPTPWGRDPSETVVQKRPIQTPKGLRK